MEPAEYEAVMRQVSDVTKLLHDFVDTFINANSRRKREINYYQNGFSDIADEIERLVRFILETFKLEDW